jgi:hypothetical protein
MKDLKPFLVAAGIAVAAALALIPEHGEINWRSVGLGAGKAFLAAAGIAVYTRNAKE